jgi:hypothetical protein
LRFVGSATTGALVSRMLASERDRGKCGELLMLERKSKMLGIEGDRPRDVFDLIADPV